MKIINEIMNMDVGAKCFLFSIVFQVSGALILLLKSFKKARKQVATAYFTADNSGEVREEDYVELSFWSVSKILVEIYCNRLSFFHLVIGYALAIWSDIGNFSKNRIFQYVVVCSFFVLIVSVVIAFLFSTIFASFYKKMQFRDLESGTRVNVITGTSKTASGEDVVHVKPIIKK